MAILGSSQALHDTQSGGTEAQRLKVTSPPVVTTRNVTRISCCAVWGFNHKDFLQNCPLLIPPLSKQAHQQAKPAPSTEFSLPSPPFLFPHCSITAAISPRGSPELPTSCTGSAQTPHGPTALQDAKYKDASVQAAWLSGLCKGEHNSDVF